jgi:hypothetical protein
VSSTVLASNCTFANAFSGVGKTLVQLGYQNNTDAVFEYNKVYDEKCPSYVNEALIPEKV